MSYDQLQQASSKFFLIAWFTDSVSYLKIHIFVPIEKSKDDKPPSLQNTKKIKARK
jgi:hypothetical protein